MLAAPLLASSGVAVAATSGVQVVDNGYSPSTITIDAGDTVRWVWAGNGRHSVTAVGGGFDSHSACTALVTATCGGTGEVFTHRFDTPGSYAYRCRVHGAAMSGTVVVREPAPPPEDPPPAEEPAPPPPAEPGQPPPAPAPPPPPGVPPPGGHSHGRAVGPAVGSLPPPPPLVPQVADPSPRPVEAEGDTGPAREEVSSAPQARASSSAGGPGEERRRVLLLAAVAVLSLSGSLTGAVALFGRPRRS